MTQVPEFVFWKLWKHRILKQFYHIQSENHTCNILVAIAKPLWPIRCKPLPRPMRIRCNWTVKDVLVTLYQNIQAFILGNTQWYVIWKSLPILFSLNVFISCWLLIYIYIHVCPLNQNGTLIDIYIYMEQLRPLKDYKWHQDTLWKCSLRLREIIDESDFKGLKRITSGNPLLLNNEYTFKARYSLWHSCQVRY